MYIHTNKDHSIPPPTHTYTHSKDFMRKAKTPCEDNVRAMTRLRKECEDAMKTLSTGSEAMIDIDVRV